MRNGYVQIYTGNGKGKTTAAIGVCIRAVAHHQKVCMLQFLKNGKSGECDILKNLGITLYDHNAPEKPPWDKSMNPQWQKYFNEQWATALHWLKEDFDLIILDELLAAFHKNFIQKDEIIEFLSKKPLKTEIIITGRNAPEWLIEAADLVTEMKDIRHYFDQGVAARAGIEY